MLQHVRFHGRGGEGVKLAARIVSRTAFLRGRQVQDSPVYGAERRGAPVTSFVRLSDAPIRERGYITCPGVVVLLDASLLEHPEAGVLEGLDAASTVLVNSADAPDVLRARHGIASRVLAVDVSSIALAILGRHLPSAPIAGFAVKAMGFAPWRDLAEAVRVELHSIELATALIERNLEATQRVFDLAPQIDAAGQRPSVPAPRAAAPLFNIPRLRASAAAPMIRAEANSALRTTDGWRVYRPLIDLARCTRCVLCFALCPEGAIGLDEQRYPVIDYAHCKGCLVCVTECPPAAIRQVREEAA